MTSLVWGCLLFAFWIALTDSTHPLELLVGGCSALIAGVLMWAVARRADVRLHPRPSWLAAFAKAPWWALRDSVTVLLALAGHLLLRRPFTGGMRPVAFDVGDRSPRGQARRAIAFGVGSAGPNSYVVGASEEEGAIVIHQLVASDEVTPREALGEGS